MSAWVETGPKQLALGTVVWLVGTPALLAILEPLLAIAAEIIPQTVKSLDVTQSSLTRFLDVIILSIIVPITFSMVLVRMVAIVAFFATFLLIVAPPAFLLVCQTELAIARAKRFKGRISPKGVLRGTARLLIGGIALLALMSLTNFTKMALNQNGWPHLPVDIILGVPLPSLMHVGVLRSIVQFSIFFTCCVLSMLAAIHLLVELAILVGCAIMAILYASGYPTEGASGWIASSEDYEILTD